MVRRALRTLCWITLIASVLAWAISEVRPSLLEIPSWPAPNDAARLVLSPGAITYANDEIPPWSGNKHVGGRLPAEDIAFLREHTIHRRLWLPLLSHNWVNTRLVIPLWIPFVVAALGLHASRRRPPREISPARFLAARRCRRIVRGTWIALGCASIACWIVTHETIRAARWTGPTRHTGVLVVRGGFGIWTEPTADHDTARSDDPERWMDEPGLSILDKFGPERGTMPTLVLRSGGLFIIVPFWLALIGCCLGFACTFRRIQAPGACAKCGYDISTIASPACPECGTPRPDA